ncbi:hypothetical protein IVG45_05210 [Methylomonas sp. LL1]|uniref:hypothetical protein n=1 Tax=Methylomonas sp. LL1 TaxID=2785785 RepID=UPI0018C41649|nr:hypothetical protein [Methylomonas sp. LL1]QPK64366.1 hypothetical protein IVG45_05210 [Methylomonas sp. LL1]
MRKINSKLLICCIGILLSGCSSFGRGIAEALLEKQETVDTRVCEITGDKFNGLKPQLDVPGRKMKVLMVHGVGNHLPGYSTQFLEKLAKELDLPVTAKAYKNITLASPKDPSKKLGNLRINRYLDKDKVQELLFYELTWSENTSKEKEVLSYDNSGEQSFRRAEVNDLLKKFSNDTGPDPIIYLGEKREDILTAFAQSFCWMINGDWNNLPDDVHQQCSSKNVTPFYNDSYAFVSHSLGSRITIDGLQRIVSILDNDKETSYYAAMADAMRNKDVPIYMMSNQLPMLQLGRVLPEITNQEAAYCRPEGEKYAERMLRKTNIIAFSDPNDLLSYALPHDFVSKYLDSRLCVNVTNININVAKIYDAFGLGRMANPMDAHIGYDTDDRVIALIAKGIANDKTAPIVNERCRWIETID